MTKTAIIAIISITAVLLLALMKGIDGNLIPAGIVIIGGLGGFTTYQCKR